MQHFVGSVKALKICLLSFYITTIITICNINVT